MKTSIALIAIASAIAMPAQTTFAQTSPTKPGAETSDRTPESKTETPLSQTDSDGGATSDRTPGKGEAAVNGSLNMKLTQAECESIWRQADVSGAGSLSPSQVQPYANDFKALDTDANGSLSSTEFKKGCEGGLVKGSSSTGAGAGTSGSSANNPADVPIAPKSPDQPPPPQQ